jgi:DNA-binding NarL/FixJ family response regulator
MRKVMMRQVHVVDDHTAIREGFRVILERSGRYEVAGESASAEAALEALGGEASARVDLVLADVSLPGRSGLELVRELRRGGCPARVVVVSMHRRFDYIAGAFKAGASAYVAKDAGAESVIAALDAAAAGEYYMDPSSLRLFVDEAAGGNEGRTPGLASLSEREREVLSLFVAGKRPEAIALELDLSPKTVENHLSNITGKLGARDRYELIRLASKELRA